MAAPSVTYTFTDGVSADASQVMTNINDLIEGWTGGRDTLTVNEFRCADLNATGACQFGAATTATAAVNARIIGSLTPKSAAAYQIGSTTNAPTSLHLNNGASDGGTVYFDGGTTTKMQVSADGTQLEFAGMNTLAGPALKRIEFRGTNVGESSAPTANIMFMNSIVKSWGKIGSAGTIFSAFNVSAVNKTGDGQYAISFDTPMSSSTYTICWNMHTDDFQAINNSFGLGFGSYILGQFYQSVSQNGFTIQLWGVDDGASFTIPTVTTSCNFCFVVYGDQ